MMLHPQSESWSFSTVHDMYFNPAVPPAAEPENVKTDKKGMHNPIQTADTASTASSLSSKTVICLLRCLLLRIW